MVGINNKTSQYSTKIILAYTLLFDFIDFETVLVRLYAFYCFFSFLSDTNDFKRKKK